MNLKSPQVNVNREIAHYKALLEIAKAIRACQHPDELFRAFARKLGETIAYKDLHILFCRDETKPTQWCALGPVEVSYSHLGAETHAWWIYSNQLPLLIPNWNEEQRFRATRELMKKVGVATSCGVPLTTAYRHLGALCVGGVHPGLYSDRDLSFLGVAGDHLALALDNILNADFSHHVQVELQVEKDRLKLLGELNSDIAANWGTKVVLRRMCENIRRVLKCDAVTILLPDANNALRVETCSSANRIPVPERSAVRGKLPRSVFQTGRYWVGASHESRASVVSVGRAVDGLSTGCLLPLSVRNTTLGVLEVSWMRKIEIARADLDFILNVAQQAAMVVETARDKKVTPGNKDHGQMSSAHVPHDICYPSSDLLRGDKQRGATRRYDPRPNHGVPHPSAGRLPTAATIPVKEAKGQTIYGFGNASVGNSSNRANLLQIMRRSSDREEEEWALTRLQEHFASLTPRQHQVMELVVSGMLNKHIAAELKISEIMVKVHRRQVMRRMGAESLPQLVRMADRLYPVSASADSRNQVQAVAR